MGKLIIDLIDIKEDVNLEKAQSVLDIFMKEMAKFSAGLKVLNAKIDILNDEFQRTYQYNPIEHIKSRIKTPKSAIAKLIRRNLSIESLDSYYSLTDIAGMRIVCSFIDDIYLLADIIKKQSDLEILEIKDYIKNPKKSGYRSLHLILNVPVYFTNEISKVKIELQIRTVAMDFWASLEHKLHYKNENANYEELLNELRVCSEHVNQMDIEMAILNRKINK